MTRAELEQELRERGFVSLDYRNSFSESVYSLQVQDDRLEFSLETRYTDDSGRDRLDHTSYFVRGSWEDFESTFR